MARMEIKSQNILILQKTLMDFRKFFEEHEYSSFTVISDNEIITAVENQKIDLKGNMENFPKDLLESTDLGPSMIYLPSFSGAKELLCLNRKINCGENIQLIVGDLHSLTPWALHVKANIYYFNEENVSGCYHFWAGNYDDIILAMKNINTQFIHECILDLDHQSRPAFESLEPHQSEETQTQLMNSFLKTKLGKTLFPLLEKKLLEKHLPQTLRVTQKIKKNI